MTATLANLTAYDYGLRVFCDHCSRHADIDVQALIKHYGDGMELSEIGHRARCNGCGGKGGSVQVVAVKW